jgi:catechol 2,3-dioxygenase-like lactoylglutathione lyase family enzyme
MVMKLSSPGIDLGIVVSDLDRSLHFYRGLLGLHHEGSNPVPGGGTMHRLWAAESMIKLVAPESPPEQPVIPGGLRAGALGLRYFTFSVADLDELMSDLKANDVPVIRDVTEMGPGVRIAIVEDPDGNHVEFLERL